MTPRGSYDPVTTCPGPIFQCPSRPLRLAQTLARNLQNVGSYLFKKPPEATFDLTIKRKLETPGPVRLDHSLALPRSFCESPPGLNIQILTRICGRFQSSGFGSNPCSMAYRKTAEGVDWRALTASVSILVIRTALQSGVNLWSYLLLHAFFLRIQD